MDDVTRRKALATVAELQGAIDGMGQLPPQQVAATMAIVYTRLGLYDLAIDCLRSAQALLLEAAAREREGEE